MPDLAAVERQLVLAQAAHVHERPPEVRLDGELPAQQHGFVGGLGGLSRSAGWLASGAPIHCAPDQSAGRSARPWSIAPPRSRPTARPPDPTPAPSTRRPRCEASGLTGVGHLGCLVGGHLAGIPQVTPVGGQQGGTRKPRPPRRHVWVRLCAAGSTGCSSQSNRGFGESMPNGSTRYSQRTRMGIRLHAPCAVMAASAKQANHAAGIGNRRRRRIGVKIQGVAVRLSTPFAEPPFCLQQNGKLGVAPLRASRHRLFYRASSLASPREPFS